jgi:hypothetical protein
MPEIVQKETQSAEQLVASLAQALETMAFVSALPPDQASGGAMRPTRAVLVSISYSGPSRGRLELVACESLGRTLAGNILGVEADDPDAVARVSDALGELLNVTCGLLLAARTSERRGRYQMAVPQVRPFVAEQEWDVFTRSPGCQVLDAEGTLLAIRGCEIA